MTANKQQRNIQIPKEAIEGPAGKNDKGVTIVAINPVVLALLKEAKNKTEVTNSTKRTIAPSSTELGITCMSISAEDVTLEKSSKEIEGK